MSSSAPTATPDPDDGPEDQRALADLDELRQELPAALVAALEPWEQGMYVRGVPLVWAGPDGPDPVFDDPATLVDADCALVSTDAEGGVFEHAVITSQTCDVVGTGTGATHPFVQVSPVRRLPTNTAVDRLSRLERYEIVDEAPISKPPGPGRWIADLRVSIPVSKAALASQKPVSAFAAGRDAVEFAKHVARKSRRPALPDVLSVDLPRSLGTWIKTDGSADTSWFESVEQVRLRITGDHLRPSEVALVVIAAEKLTTEQCLPWRRWRASFSKVLIKPPHSIQFEPVQFTTMDRMSARLYRDTVWVRLPELKRGRPTGD
jgi:hypothetical protein